nr:hypothetical protein [Angustibacter aerolatus]
MSAGRRLPVRALADAVPDAGPWQVAVRVLATAPVVDLDGVGVLAEAHRAGRPADDERAHRERPGRHRGAAGRRRALDPAPRRRARRGRARGAAGRARRHRPGVRGPAAERAHAEHLRRGLLAALDAAPEGLRAPGSQITAERRCPATPA